MGFEFDRDSEVVDNGASTYSAQLSGGWLIGGGLNGGYQLAVIANALRAASPDRPDPVVMSAHFMAAATEGEATIHTRMLREGGRLATLSAELIQNDTHCVSATATYGDAAAMSTDVATMAGPPDIPPVDACLSAELAPPGLRSAAPMLERLDLRLDPSYAGWARDQPSRSGVIQGWLRFADRREPDTRSLLFAVDALPPVTFDLGLPGWAPTIQLTAHVRAIPEPGWLLVRHATRNVAGGMFEEDCDIWDSSRRLVAQSRQLARLPR